MNRRMAAECRKDNIIDIEDTSSGEVITQPFSPNDINLSNPPMNLGDLIDRIEYGWIDFNTEYQREENLWSEGKQSRLIESALLGLRFPAFYFEEISKKQWKIIDGMQRCCAIRNFCVKDSLALTELEFLEFNGRRYKDLPFELRRDIRMLPITVNLLNKGVPDEVKYILFKRLNGGIELTPQEIRNAVYQGVAIDLVKELAAEDAFIKATGGKIPVKRGEDRDFISRFIAFYLMGYTDYQPDLDRFINDCMKKLKAHFYPGDCIDKMKTDFIKAMELAYEVFGKEAFRKRESMNDKRKPINKAYFEVIAVTFAKLSEEDRLLLRRDKNRLNELAMEEMRENKTYNISFSGATGRVDNVRRRFSVFKEIVNRVLGRI